MNKDVYKSLIDGYSQYLEKQKENINLMWRRFSRVDVVEIKVPRFSGIVEGVLGEALERYHRSPNKKPGPYPLLNWRGMKESGKIDESFNNKKGAILFYYSKPIAPHLTINGLEEYKNINGSLVSIPSLADTILYYRFALFSLFSGKMLIVADESRYVLNLWNREIKRYPMVYLEISDKRVKELLDMYGVPTRSIVANTKYCDEAGLLWLKLEETDLKGIYGMVMDRTTKIFYGNKDERFYRLLTRVERFVDDYNLRMVMTSHLLASQELILGEYRKVPEELLHISITGKKDKYELKTPGNTNPNYGVTVVENNKLKIVPLHSLLTNLNENITLVLVRAGNTSVISTYYFTTPKPNEDAYKAEFFKLLKSNLLD